MGGVMPGTRVVITALMGLSPEVLLDGVVQSLSLQPGGGPGNPDMVTMQGEDLTVLMDQTHVSRERLGPTLETQVLETLAPYLRHGIVPMVIPARTQDVFSPLRQVNLQHGTDYQFLTRLGQRCGHVVRLLRGPAPTTSRLYWGPPSLLRTMGMALPLPALSVNMGPATNVTGLTFSFNGAAAAEMAGAVLRSGTVTATPSDKAPLSLVSAYRALAGQIRKGYAEEISMSRHASQARARAQALADASVEEVVDATGSVDVLRYGALLKPWGIVGLRGAGLTFDGEYQVGDLGYEIGEGSFQQTFNLTRSGLGARSPVVRP
jgi:hypothetical protein